MTWKNWGDHPLVASISVISGLAGIVALGLALRQPNLPTPLAEPMLQGQYSRFADVPNLPVGLFNYGGSTSWASVRSEIDPEIQKSQPNFKLRYVHPINGQPSSGTGIRMLLDGELAFAQSSRPLSDKAIQEAKVRGITLKQIPVAINGIAIIVHPDLKLAGLTIEQLRAIYTGQVQNWQELGGSDLPIVPFHRIQASGGNTNFFLNDDEELGTNTRHVSTPTEGVQRVAKTLGGIYYGSAAILASQCSVRVLPIGPA